MTRLPLKTDDEFDDSTRAVFADMAARGAEPPDLYRLIANAPGMLEAWTDLAWPLRNLAHAERSLREILIMRTAQLTNAHYEWTHHWKLALASGVSERQLHSIANWRDADCFSPAERAALGLADELIQTHRVSDEAFAELRRHFDAAAVIQLVMTASIYLGLAHFISALQLDLEPRYESVPPLAQQEKR